MVVLLCFVLAALASSFKLKSRLEAENATLRHQLIVLLRKMHLGTAEDFDAIYQTERDKWARVIKATGMDKVVVTVKGRTSGMAKL